MTKSKFVSMTNLQRRAFFSSELKRALDRNGITPSELADQLSLSYHRVRHWVKGRSMPCVQTIALIAEHLGDDELARAGISASHRTCANCGKEYTQDSAQGRSYLCSASCRRESERLRTKMGKSSVAQATFEVPKVYQIAVEKFCRACEPGGLCHDGKCPLRPISPIPLFSKSEAVFSSGAKMFKGRKPLSTANK
jgi:transcriptional regulator with XRE-family HTH domain